MVEFGVYVPQYGSAIEPDTFRAIVQETEEEGFDSLWLGEHLGLPLERKMDTWGFGKYPVEATRPWLETITGLTFMAAVTSRCRLGIAAMAVPWRHPFITAKELTSIDNLSKGRLIIGAGTGYFTEEFAALGLPYEDRGILTDEALEAWQVLFTDPAPEFHGDHYSFSNLSFFPKPVQKPGPPIWVACRRLTTPIRRRIVRFGDGWLQNLFSCSPQDLAEGLARVRLEMKEAGREDDGLDVCLWAPTRVGERREEGWVPWRDNLIDGTPEEVYETYAAYTRAGCTHFVICVGGPPPERMRQLRAFSTQIIPEIRKEVITSVPEPG